MGLVDLSYGPFGYPTYGPFGHPLYGPFGLHTYGLLNLMRASSPLQHAKLDGPNRGLCAIRDPELADGAAHVLLDGAHADEQAAGCLLVRVTSCY